VMQNAEVRLQLAWRMVEVPAHGRAGPYKMAVHAGDDIVSSVVARGGRWEPRLSSIIVREIYRIKLSRSRVHMLDVGANIGWFTLLAAAHGANVTAVEPNRLNAWLIRQSLSANNQLPLSQRVDVHNLGAGAKSNMTCNLISPDNNVGDTMLSCGSLYDDLARWNAWGSTQRLKYHYASRGTLRIMRLDDLLGRDSAPVDILKIDIEAYEPLAAQGWTGLFDRHPPSLVISEFQPSLLHANGFDAADYLRFFLGRGYVIRRPRPHIRSITDLATFADLARWLNATSWTRSYDLEMVLTEPHR